MSWDVNVSLRRLISRVKTLGLRSLEASKVVDVVSDGFYVEMW